MLKGLVLRATLFALICLLPFAQEAMADQKVSVNVPPGDLGVALATLAKQSGVEFIYQADQLRGLRTNGVTGTYTAPDAVRVLLKGTTLEFRTDPSGAMLIAQPRSNTNSWTQHRAGGTDTPKEGKSDSSGGFRVAQVDETTAGSRLEQGTGEAQNKSVPLEEVVVTGTHLRGAGPASSPLITFSRADLSHSGAATVDQFMRKVPQNFASTDAASFLDTPGGTPNQARGGAIDLRGLGDGATLVLLDGNRLAPSGTNGSFVDVSMIPLSAIDHVDLLTDGASAVYGADAVAGVVNFVLRKDFSGAESSVRYGGATLGGAPEFTASQLLGKPWFRGNAMLAYEYDDQGGLDAKDRTFIPPFAGTFDILPRQVRHNLVLSGSQGLGSTLTLAFDGIYGHRRFVSDNVEFGQPNHTYGNSQQYGGSLALTYDIGGGWYASASGTHFDEDESAFNQVAGATGVFEHVHSQVMSLEAKADGPLLELPAGQFLASFGSALRGEELNDHSGLATAAGQAHRTISSAFGEILVPIAGEWNRVLGAPNLALSVAARFDRYSDVGSSTNPKIGVVWSPVDGFTFRSTYSTSYRVPPIAQLSARGLLYFLFPFPSQTGPVRAALISAPGNSGLRPERSRSLTAGFDFHPRRSPGLTFSGTYFNINYTNRIAAPPVVGSAIFAFQQQTTLAPFISFAPNEMQIQQDIANGARLSDPFKIGLPNITATFDDRLHNIAKSRVQGVDLSTKYDFPTRLGDWDIFLNGTYLSQLTFQVTQGTPAVSLLDTTFHPVDLRLRGGLDWSYGSFGVTLSANYTDGYQNNLVSPAGSIDAWTTGDLQVRYKAGDQHGWRSNLVVALDVQNITDKPPPRFATSALQFNLGYDPTNATALGRLVSLQLTKRL